MRPSSARRIANMHRLAAALAAGGGMELAELTRMLQVSERTVRDYLAEFK
jgi:transposase